MTQYILPARQLNFLAYVFCQKMLDRAKNLKKIDVLVGTIDPLIQEITMREALKICKKNEALWRTFKFFIKKIRLDSSITNDKQAKARIIQLSDQLPHHAVYSLVFVGPVKTRCSFDVLSYSTSLFSNHKVQEENKAELSKFLRGIEIKRPEVGSKCDQDFRLMRTWNPLLSGVSLFTQFSYS